MEQTAISLKTSLEILKIGKACAVIEELFRKLRGLILPGIRTRDIDAFCELEMDRCGVRSAVMGYKGFPAHVCVSVNSIVAHGIPGDYALNDGDVVSIDISLSLNGWFGDGTWTYVVGQPSPNAKRLVKAAWQATVAGIRAAMPGNTLCDIGKAIDAKARDWGCEVFSEYAGHGIGRSLHEDPLILHSGDGAATMEIVPGMVFTIEPILTLGKAETRPHTEGIILARDNQPTAQYEHTVAVYANRTEVLTCRKQAWSDYLDFPPFI